MRDYDDIVNAQLEGDLDSTIANVDATPPGYMAGFEIAIVNNQVNIGPGVANVRGRVVQKVDTETVTTDDSRGEAFASNTDYYVYLSSFGGYFTDKIEPQFDAGLYGKYHPVLGYRFIGSISIDENGDVSEVISENPVNANSISLDRLAANVIESALASITNQVTIGTDGIYGVSDDEQWRIIIQSSTIKLQSWDGAAWQTQGEVGSNSSQVLAVYAQLRGLVSYGYDIDSVDIGTRAPDGSYIFHLDSDYMAVFGEDLFDTRNNVQLSDVDPKFGSHCLSSTASDGLVQASALFDVDYIWSTNFWFKQATVPSITESQEVSQIVFTDDVSGSLHETEFTVGLATGNPQIEFDVYRGKLWDASVPNVGIHPSYDISSFGEKDGSYEMYNSGMSYRDGRGYFRGDSSKEKILYRTDDDGDSWNEVYTAEDWIHGVIAGDNDRVVIITDGGVFTSTDAGITFTKTYDLPSGVSLTSKQISGDVSSTGDWIIVFSYYYMIRSTNNGNSWTESPIDWNGNGLVLRLGVMFLGNVPYVGVTTSSDTFIYTSSDLFDTYTQVHSLGFSLSDGMENMSCDTNGIDTLVFSTVSYTIVSYDSGSSWASYYHGIGPSGTGGYSIQYLDDGTWMAIRGSTGGYCVSTDGAQTFTVYELSVYDNDWYNYTGGQIFSGYAGLAIGSRYFSLGALRWIDPNDETNWGVDSGTLVMSPAAPKRDGIIEHYIPFEQNDNGNIIATLVADYIDTFAPWFTTVLAPPTLQLTNVVPGDVPDISSTDFVVGNTSGASEETTPNTLLQIGSDVHVATFPNGSSIDVGLFISGALQGAITVSANEWHMLALDYHTGDINFGIDGINQLYGSVLPDTIGNVGIYLDNTCDVSVDEIFLFPGATVFQNDLSKYLAGDHPWSNLLDYKEDLLIASSNRAVFDGDLYFSGDVRASGAIYDSNGDIVTGLNDTTLLSYQIDKTTRNFSTSWADGWITDPFIVPPYTTLVTDFALPARNNSTGWGGGYVEVFYDVNMSGSWISLGSSGYDMNVMYSSASSIATYTNHFVQDFSSISEEMQVRYKFRHCSYDGTVTINGSHSISDGAVDSFAWSHIIVTRTHGAKGPQGERGVQGQVGPPGATGQPGLPFHIKVSGLAANLSTYDDEEAGFTYYATDEQLIYQKMTDDSGDWTPGIPFGVPAGLVEENVFSNANTITSSPNFQTGRNYMMVGPVDIADGVVINIPDGVTWVVI